MLFESLMQTLRKAIYPILTYSNFSFPQVQICISTILVTVTHHKEVWSEWSMQPLVQNITGSDQVIFKKIILK